MHRVLWGTMPLFLMMNLWAGCGNLPLPNSPSTDKDIDRPTSGDDDPGGPPPNTGILLVHGAIDGNPEDCRVATNAINEEDPWVDVGGTGEEIVLEADEYVVSVGDAHTTGLGGVPLHRNDLGYWTPDNWGTFEVLQGKITEVTIDLVPLDRHRCESWQCPWPYEGQDCDIPLASNEQWITVQDGILRGSQDDCFGGQCGILIHLDLDTNTIQVEGTDPGTEILEQSYNAQMLSFSYLFGNDLFGVGALVNCERAQ